MKNKKFLPDHVPGSEPLDGCDHLTDVMDCQPDTEHVPKSTLTLAGRDRDQIAPTLARHKRPPTDWGTAPRGTHYEAHS